MVKTRKTHVPLTKSQSMGRVRQKGTSPELKLRKALWSHGFRYRLNVRSLPGTPDIVISKAKLAIFVHGCFWHNHGCTRSNKLPVKNAEFWAEKLRRNQVRDEAAQAELGTLGWRCATVWECEETAASVDRIRQILQACALPMDPITG